MPVEVPQPFSMKDLFLDVDLTACVDGTAYDLSGKKTFNTQFYRDNIGFGITDISIEINPSLQPLVEIEFKDLYGNTIFGTKKGSDLDHSILFNWPPPKFLFSFKGYLGKKVTWILNLKRHDVRFNSSDGSYTIRCSFVPNQWGFFSDVPFLYLLSVKYLRKKYYAEEIRAGRGLKKCEEGKVSAPTLETDLNVQSTFDLMRMGRQLELKTKETTKEFDEIRKQMTDAKYTACQSLYKTQTLEVGRPITGEVNGIMIGNDADNPSLTFTPICFVEDDYIGGDNFASQSQIETLLKLPTEIPKLNTFLLIKMQISLDGENFKPLVAKGAGEISAKDITYKQYFAGDDSTWKETGQDDNGNDKPGEKIRLLKVEAQKYLDQNLKLIDTEIQRRVYNSSKYQLSKLTISQVFSQIARDSAFILGLVIENGLRGYQKNQTRRDELSGSLIGKSYPLFITKKGEEVPATEENLEENIGVEKYELQFVRNFIEGVSQGISENLVNGGNVTGDEYKLVKRINNLEAASPNPYRPFYKNIAENILIRSGIAAFITRSNDPNKPGSFYNTFGSTNDADWNNIASLARADLENITDDILLQMSFDEKSRLLRFCKFFDRLLDEDGVDFLNAFGNTTGWMFANACGYGKAVPNSILDYQVVMTDYDYKEILSKDESLAFKPQPAIINFLKTIPRFRDKLETLTLRQILVKELLGKEPALLQRYDETDGYPSVNPITGEQTASVEHPIGVHNTVVDDTISNVSMIDPVTLNATCVKNNGHYYCYANYPSSLSAGQNIVGGAPVGRENGGTLDNNPYWSVIFEGSAAQKALEATNAPSDGEEEDFDRSGSGRFAELVGFVPIDSVYKKVVGSNLRQRVESINDYITREVVISERAARSLKRPPSDAPIVVSFTNQYNLDQFRGTWTSPITSSLDTKFAFAAYGHQDEYAGSIVFAPFAGFNSTPMFSEFYYDVGTGSTEQAMKEREKAIIEKFKSGPMDVLEGMVEIGHNNFPANQRAYIKTMAKGILDKIEELEEKKNQVLGELFGRAAEQENLIYKQMHHIYHQWYTVMGASPDSPCTSAGNSPDGLAVELEYQYGGCNKHFQREPNSDIAKTVELDGGLTYFVYDYPLQHITGNNDKYDGKGKINAAHSIINIDPLSEADANTTVLGMIQQLCTKNNFIFVPIPGDIGANDVSGIYRPYQLYPLDSKVQNHFHVMFSPTPESRSLLSDEKFRLGDFTEEQKEFEVNAINIQFGSVYNQVVRNLDVSTQETKPTAESIINLQRLVDNENQNKQVTTDCSMLSVMEGRSYKATCEILGNSQVYPMQFFFIDKQPLFSGLYQIMKVTHSISPNDMSTTFEGIRMRFTPNQKYGGIPPITFEDYEKLGALSERRSLSFSALSIDRKKVEDVNTSYGTAGGFSPGSDVTRLELTDPPRGPIAAASAPSPVSIAGMQVFMSGQPYQQGKPIGSAIECVKLGRDFKEDLSANGKLVNKAIAPHLLALHRDLTAYLKEIRSESRPELSSAFRSFQDQIACRISNLKSQYRSQIFSWTGNYLTASKTIINQQLYDKIILSTAGSKMKAFDPATATPGWSQHNNGIAFDIMVLGYDKYPQNSYMASTTAAKQKDRDAYKWLVGNAHRYGFIRTVVSEGWHWEYRPGWGAFNGIGKNDPSWLGIPAELEAENPEEFGTNAQPSYKKIKLPSGIIISVPTPKPVDGYDVMVVYGGLYYATPDWMWDKIPESKRLQYLFVVVPHDMLYDRSMAYMASQYSTKNPMRSDFDKFTARDQMMSYMAQEGLKEKTLSICGFSNGGLQTIGAAAKFNFSVVGLMDPSVPSSAIYENSTLFGKNVNLFYGSTEMENIYNTRYVALSNKINSAGGSVQKTTTPQQHNYYAEEYFRKFI